MANDLDRLEKIVSGGSVLSPATGNAIVRNGVTVPLSSFIQLERMVDGTVFLTGGKMNAGNFLFRMVAGSSGSGKGNAGENGLQE